jgi:hypothetical protein
MGESGLSPSEVGKEIAEHRHRSAEHGEATGQDRWVTIVEALLLAVVAVLAAWSGYASAKWGTESSLTLAQASAARTAASRADLEALETRNFDASTFDAWFTAYTAGDESAMALAEKRFTPEFDEAFRAWIATDPANNPDAPKGPTFMPEYEQPKREEAIELDRRAEELYAEGAKAGSTADDYVRTTVFLASVLFLVGISGHFRVKVARYGLVGVGAAILVLSVTLLIAAPKPPS